jgi:hypothetical protein
MGLMRQKAQVRDGHGSARTLAQPNDVYCKIVFVRETLNVVREPRPPELERR